MKINKHRLCVVLPACLCFFASQLHAEDLICDGGPGFACDLPPFVDGDVIVTNGTLARTPRDQITVVTGDVIAIDGGRLSLRDIIVEGDIVGDGFNSIRIATSFVGGDVELQGQADVRPSLSLSRTTVLGDVSIAENPTDSIGVVGCNIGGNLLVAENTTRRLLLLSRNDVGGSLLLFDNRVTEDDIFVLRNTILGDLLCTGNDPDPILSRNEVTGAVICDD